ncbi:hypothetical protein EG329_013836 [Mollisiaceae sp. DMI_Dod_QoI]|nr:hypothetical protein EG329_013836 [Helotiales sp. DMI_Dod_QoI]
MASYPYSPLKETYRFFNLLRNDTEIFRLPPSFSDSMQNVAFESDFSQVYFPIPLKETEIAAALKAVEGCVASALADLRGGQQRRMIKVNLEKTTCWLMSMYLAKIGGLSKLDDGVKDLLKDTDLLHSQSDPYRRMAAGLYATKDPGRYYHIHGSLDATTTLNMLGLDSYRPDLRTHEDISNTIERAVMDFTVAQLEDLNNSNRQAGVEALKYEDFLQTPHGQVNDNIPPWSVTCLESQTPAIPLLPPTTNPLRILKGIKVLELCRIIAGLVIGRTLAEYGAEVLKITSPKLSDIPFFQVDVNMGKHTAELDLTTPEGRQIFEDLLQQADVILDGYRPGAFEKLGYGVEAITELGKKRGKGYVYVNENCFGFEGEWAHRPGWQQIADCVSGVAWAQGAFLHPTSPGPIVPPFPMPDYGTGCLGAIAALSEIYHRAVSGGSWHGRTSILSYNLLLLNAGLYPPGFQAEQRALVSDKLFGLKHSASPEDVIRAMIEGMKKHFPHLWDEKWREKWWCEKYRQEVEVVKPVVEIEGVDIGWKRGSRPNGSDEASWEFGVDEDYQRCDEERSLVFE